MGSLATGLLMALVVVMFSFGGTELIGITAGETEDPRRTIPRATNGIIWRILVFYIGALGVIELSDFRLRHDIMFLFPKNSNFRADYTAIFRELRACAEETGSA